MNSARRFPLILLCSLFALPAWAEPNMHDGKWEITTQMEIPGLPFAPPPVKYTQCLSKQDAVPQQSEQKNNCKMISNDIQGDTVFWVVECKEKVDTVRSTGQVTYHKDRFEGTINIVSSGKNGGTMSSKMSGKRLGDCK